MDGANPVDNDRPAGSAGPGELILQNGRQAGVRRPLGVPATLVGRHPSCEVRLNVDGVEPMHCILIARPDGVHLRDLNSTLGTLVNGKRVESALLRHGDVVKVGPFLFRVHLPAPSETPPADDSLEVIRDGLRVQAAAVAAQQIALEEEETRLQQRRHDLQQQEEQLAAHLAEKQRQVQIWSDFTKSERETLHKERLEHEKQVAGHHQELQQARQLLADAHAKIQAERERIQKVYERLRTRWRKHAADAHKKHAEEMHKLQREAQTLQEGQTLLAARESAHTRDVLNLNAERELFTRQQRDQETRLAGERHAWRRRRDQERRVLAMERLALAQAKAELQEAWDLFRTDKANWDDQRTALESELHGLHNRILHQRLKLQEQHEELARLDVARRDDGPTADAATPECEVEVLGDCAANDRIERLTSELADQRAHLLEQFARLAELHAVWQRQRDHAAAELERLAQRLLAQDEELGQRDRQTILLEQALHERQSEIEATRQDLQMWRAQCLASQAALAHEQETLTAALRDGQAELQKQLSELADLRQHWSDRQGRDFEELQSVRTLAEKQHHETQQLRMSLFEKRARLEDDLRALALKALTLEEYRREVFFQANDPAAQKRVDKLRRRWLTLNAVVIRTARKERDALHAELQRLQAERASLQESSRATSTAVAELAQKEARLQEIEALLKARQLQLENEQSRVASQRSADLRIAEQVDILAQAVYQTGAAPIDKAA